MSKLSRRAFLQHSALTGIALRTAESAEPKEKKLRVLTLEGTPRERGVSHGRTLKEPIRELLKLWKADLVARYQMDADLFIKKFVRHTNYPAAIKKWTPDLLEEIQGIAEGAGVDFDTMFVFQLIDEYWVNGPGVAGEHCSALGIGRRGNHPCHVAQNMDLEGFRDGFQTILHLRYPDSKLEAFVLTHAGLIGLNGMNNRALGVCVNTLSQLAHNRDGLPVACVVRGLLQQETEAAALEFLRRVKHASGQNYVVGGPERVYDYECSSGKARRFTPSTGPDVVWHTNHPLVNDDYSAAYRRALDQKKGSEKEEGNSAIRLQLLQRRLEKATATPILELIQTTLTAKDSAEHPVCRAFKNQKDGYTFASTIMVLGEKPALHVAAGPPDRHAYQKLVFAI